MMPLEKLRKEVHVLMFDLYGTVVDMQGGLVAAVTPYLEKKGWQGRPDALVTWVRTHIESRWVFLLALNGPH